MALSFTETELASMNLEDLYKVLSDNSGSLAPEDEGALDQVLRASFGYLDAHKDDLSPESVNHLLQMSDYLAVKYGLPTAVEHYSKHLTWNEDWKEGADLKYSFKDENGPDGFIHKALRAKIVRDIAAIAGTGEVQDIDSATGNLDGIKIKDNTIANDVISELKKNKGPDMEKFDTMSDEEKKESLSWWLNFAKKTPDLTWSAWQKTWAKAQQSILDNKKTITDMGEEMCLQIFLLPFKMFENWTAKIDDWAKDFAKQRNQFLLENAKPKPVSAPDDSHDSDDPTKDAKDLMKFMSLYIGLVEKEGETDPERKKFAEELKAAWGKGGLTKETFDSEYPDLQKRLFKDFDHTLVENFVNAMHKDTKDLTDFDHATAQTVQFFFQVKYIPDRIKNDIFDKFEKEGITLDDWYKKTSDDHSDDHSDDGHHDDHGGDGHEGRDGDDGHRDDHSGDDYPPESAPARAEARIRTLLWGKSETEGIGSDGKPFKESKTDALRSPYLISAKTVEKKDAAGKKTGETIHRYGTIVDDKSKTITRYHEQDGKITSVTYFVEKGSAVIRESTVDKDGKIVSSKKERHLEGLATESPKLDGKDLPDYKAQQWTDLFARNSSTFQIGVATKFNGYLGPGHLIANIVQDETERSSRWDLVRKTVNSR